MKPWIDFCVAFLTCFWSSWNPLVFVFQNQEMFQCWGCKANSTLASTETMTTFVHWTMPLKMSLSSKNFMCFELVMWPFQTILSKGERAPAVLLPHDAKQTLPTHFVLNAMATTTYHNQFIRDLNKKCTIIFYMIVQVIVVHNSHILSNGHI